MGNCRIFRPASIVERDEVNIITLEDGVLDNICDNQLFGIALLNSIPNTSRNNRLYVTDGTTNLDIYSCNQYYRPCELPCDRVMWICKKPDPDTIGVFCRFSNYNRGCY